MPKLEKGNLAPEFSLYDENNELVSLSLFKGSRVVVYFYPADDTPGCTKEACQFSELSSQFDSNETTVLGISPDDAESHKAFRNKYGLSIRLLSDPDHSVMERYGAFGEKTLYGKKSIGVIRTTVLIGPDGRVERAWYHVRADGHAAKVLGTLGS
jgi:peroxiredoxin Q/BCP